MPSFFQLVWSLGPWSWLFLAIILFALETVIPGVHLLWFGLAALIVAVAALGLESLSPGALEVFSWPWQLIAFAIVSFVTVFFVRRYAHPENAESDEPDLNIRGAQYLGRTVIVAAQIKDGRGKVRVGDTLWPAQGEDIPVGARVKVTGVNGTVLVVERES